MYKRYYLTHEDNFLVFDAFDSITDIHKKIGTNDYKVIDHDGGEFGLVDNLKHKTSFICNNIVYAISDDNMISRTRAFSPIFKRALDNYKLNIRKEKLSKI